MMNLPKLVITDIDGVWTDGGMYYDQNGNEFKKFNTSDSAGVLFCKILSIPIAIITGEDTNIVTLRAKKLGIDLVYLGIKDKLQVAESLCRDLNINLSDVAYIGDDINDIKLLEYAGVTACPANSPIYIKNKVMYVTDKKGGDGAFREFIEKILSDNNLLEQVLDNYLSNKTILRQ